MKPSEYTRLAKLFDKEEFTLLARELNQIPPYEVLHFVTKCAIENSWIAKDEHQGTLVKLLNHMTLNRTGIALAAERNSVKMQREHFGDRYVVTVSNDRHTVTANQVASCVHPEQAATIKNAYVNIGYVDLTEPQPGRIIWKKGDKVAWQSGELEIRQGTVSQVTDYGLLYIKVKGGSTTAVHDIHCRRSIADFK